MRDKSYLFLFITVMIILVFTLWVYAAGQSSTNYTIESDVISGGGGDSSSTNYSLEQTTGQSSVIGDSSSSSFSIYPGFWNTLSVTGDNGYSSHTYDTNQDWVIGDFELLTAIDDWASGLLGDFELLNLIDFWAAGCYHWDASSSSYKAGC